MKEYFRQLTTGLDQKGGIGCLQMEDTKSMACQSIMKNTCTMQWEDKIATFQNRMDQN